MAGGLMQLVAYGAQDVYLTGQPKVTFFQAVYKRHTNFAMENIQQTVNGSASNSGRVSVTIARNGDLVGDMYIRLQPTMQNSANLTSTGSNFDSNWVAERSIASIELTIGGQRIDKHYQAWWRLYAELFLGESDKINYGKMTSSPVTVVDTTNLNSVYLPLLFFFNRNPGLYLPLIALQYHEVRLDFDLTSSFASYFGSSSPAFEVWANYVYLDTEERRRFAQKGHEYLIEQVQHTGGDQLDQTGSVAAQLVRLSFNHPVKELIWCYQNPAATSTAQLNGMWNFCTSTANVNVSSNLLSLQASNNYVMPNVTGVPQLVSTSGVLSSNVFGLTNFLGCNAAYWVEQGLPILNNLAPGVEVGPLNQFKVILNGQDRFKEQYGNYFNQVQPFYHHTGTPYPGIYVYSFALQPEEHQPTGTCNFSRIDNAQVSVAMKGANNSATLQKLFAVNYNILRIQSGMGGLAFSN